MRSFLILVLILSCGLGSVAHIINKARVQRKTVTEIERAGANVMYDWMWMADVGARNRASQQYQMLMGDALSVVVLQSSGLTHLASNDADF
jgi:hypothetical protein